jgi:hypothetical protein
VIVKKGSEFGCMPWMNAALFELDRTSVRQQVNAMIVPWVRVYARDGSSQVGILSFDGVADGLGEVGVWRRHDVFVRARDGTHKQQFLRLLGSSWASWGCRK